MSRFRLVTFDATNTLLKFKVSVGEEYSQTAKLYGITAKTENLNVAFKKEFSKLKTTHPNFGAATGMTSREWWSEVIKRTFSTAGHQDLSSAQLTPIVHHLYKSFATSKCWSVTDGASEILPKLKDAGLKLGVISNFDERLKNVLFELGLLHYFDFVLSSYLVKCEKPDKEIFNRALKEVNENINPEDAVHIGDDVETDYLGSRMAGWNSLLFCESSKVNIDKVKSNDIVPNLKDLEKHILK